MFDIVLHMGMALTLQRAPALQKPSPGTSGPLIHWKVPGVPARLGPFSTTGHPGLQPALGAQRPSSARRPPGADVSGKALAQTLGVLTFSTASWPSSSTTARGVAAMPPARCWGGGLAACDPVPALPGLSPVAAPPPLRSGSPAAAGVWMPAWRVRAAAAAAAAAAAGIAAGVGLPAGGERASITAGPGAAGAGRAAAAAAVRDAGRAAPCASIGAAVSGGGAWGELQRERLAQALQEQQLRLPEDAGVGGDAHELQAQGCWPGAGMAAQLLSQQGNQAPGLACAHTRGGRGHGGALGASGHECPMPWALSGAPLVLCHLRRALSGLGTEVAVHCQRRTAASRATLGLR
ncbi:MAG: hypothetical protein WDW38_010179 [Sanguina aurantia]